ncbi:MAG: ABC transporter permease, partial [Phycisphaerales bacterium]
MSILYQDLRYAVRTMVKRPGFTGFIILTLALGIGANTAMFSVLRAVLLKPLSLEEPHDLVYVAERHEGERRAGGRISYDNLDDLRAQSTSLEDLGGFAPAMFTLSEAAPPERVAGAIVTASLLSLLGVQPTLGRVFDEGEDKPGSENVAVISNGCWQQRFGADSNIIGRALTLDNLGFTVVGVLPEGFDLPIGLGAPEIWTTTARDATVYT